MKSSLDESSLVASSCDADEEMNPLAKGNSCAMPPAEAWLNSWYDEPAGPTNPLAGEVAAVAAAGGPAGEAQNPFVADDVPPAMMEPEN